MYRYAEAAAKAAGVSITAETDAGELAVAVEKVISPGHIPPARVAVACADAVVGAVHAESSRPIALDRAW